MDQENNLVRQCMGAYGVKSISKLVEATEVPYTTLSTWDSEGPSKIGTLLLTALIENIEMKKNVKALIQAEEMKTTALQSLKNQVQT